MYVQYWQRYDKKSQFLHDDEDNDGANAIAIPRVFSENSRVQNLEKKAKNDLKSGW